MNSIGDILVGEYRILDFFGGSGKSGMGVVYLVEDRDHDTPIVIKTYQESEFSSVERLKAEAEVWINLGIHQNIVEALFARQINEQLFIGAEYIEPDEYGRNTLTHYIAQGAISDKYAMRWAVQFCHGMRHAQMKGLRVHRDIKPDNLMIDATGNLKITDFGLAKAMHADLVTNHHNQNPVSPIRTNPGSFLGTGLYASPEQFEDASSIDFRSDIYSFGIVLFQTISGGQYPYEHRGRTTLEQVALMHWIEPVVELANPFFPIVKRCLEKNAEERYQSFDSLLDDLLSLANALEISVPEERMGFTSQTRELYRQALMLTEVGKIEKASTFINQLLAVDATDSSAWQLKGRLLDQLGNTEEGIDATLKSLELDPNNSHTLNNLGMFLGKVGRLDEGIAYLMEAIKADGYNAVAVMNLAISLDQRGAYIGAADIVIKALELTPDKKRLHFNAGNIAASAMKNGHGEKALQILKRLFELGTTNPAHLFNLGLCYKSIGDKDAAVEVFEKVLELEPLDDQAHLFLAQTYGELGRYIDAIQHCDFLLENELSLLKASSYKAQFMQATGKGSEAIRFIKSILNKGNSESDPLWMLLGTLYENESKYEVAKRCYEQAKSIVFTQKNPNCENIEYLETKIRRMTKLARN